MAMIRLFFLSFMLISTSASAQYATRQEYAEPVDEADTYDPLPKWDYTHPIYEITYDGSTQVPSVITPIEDEVGKMEMVSQNGLRANAATSNQESPRSTKKATARVLSAVKKATEEIAVARAQASKAKK